MSDYLVKGLSDVISSKDNNTIEDPKRMLRAELSQDIQSRRTNPTSKKALFQQYKKCILHELMEEICATAGKKYSGWKKI